MSTVEHRTPKTGRQSLFFQDLATPISDLPPPPVFTLEDRSEAAAVSALWRENFKNSDLPPPPVFTLEDRSEAAAVSALWRENFKNSDLPPPPVFTLEDRSDFSPESGIPDYPASPGVNSDPRTPVRRTSREFSTPKSKSEASTSYALMGKQQQQQTQRSPLASSSRWSSSKSGGSAEQDDKGNGSPVEGVVQPGALITLPPPREVARPEMKKNVVPVGNLDEEEWVTVYGFSPADTNLVLREFENFGVILKHVPGPGAANWMHILYQSRSDAQKALSKNGMQLKVFLIIGVKSVDPIQRQALNGRLNNQGFMPLPPPPLTRTPESRF